MGLSIQVSLFLSPSWTGVQDGLPAQLCFDCDGQVQSDSTSSGVENLEIPGETATGNSDPRAGDRTRFRSRSRSRQRLTALSELDAGVVSNGGLNRGLTTAGTVKYWIVAALAPSFHSARLRIIQGGRDVEDHEPVEKPNGGADQQVTLLCVIASPESTAAPFTSSVSIPARGFDALALPDSEISVVRAAFHTDRPHQQPLEDRLQAEERWLSADPPARYPGATQLLAELEFDESDGSEVDGVFNPHARFRYYIGSLVGFVFPVAAVLMIGRVMVWQTGVKGRQVEAGVMFGAAVNVLTAVVIALSPQFGSS